MALNTASSPQLRFESVGYRTCGQTLIDSIDFFLTTGDVVALAGASGVGKTTLLHLALGLLTPTRGRLDNRFSQTSCMFQEPRLLPWFSARDNIALGLKAAGIGAAERRRRADTIGERMGLRSVDLDKYPSALSGGMAQRVALARALIVSPQLLLLDEPFSALDFGLKQALYDLLLAEIGDRRLTVLVVTHDLLETVRLAKTIVLMHKPPLPLSVPIAIDTPWSQRTQQWVFRTAAGFIARQDFRQAFLSPENSAAETPSRESFSPSTPKDLP